MYSKGSGMATLVITILLICLLTVLFAAFGTSSLIWKMSLENCVRPSGRLSSKRILREARSATDYLTTVGFPALVTTGVLYAFSLWMFTNLMPEHQIERAFAVFSFDHSEWKESLIDVRQDHMDWLRVQHQITGENARLFQRYLWGSWPAVLLVFAVILAVGVMTQQKVTRLAAVDFAESVVRRRSKYLTAALHGLYRASRATGTGQRVAVLETVAVQVSPGSGR